MYSVGFGYHPRVPSLPQVVPGQAPRGRTEGLGQKAVFFYYGCALALQIPECSLLCSVPARSQSGLECLRLRKSEVFDLRGFLGDFELRVHSGSHHRLHWVYFYHFSSGREAG